MAREARRLAASFFAAAARGRSLRWVGRVVVLSSLLLSAFALLALRSAENAERLSDLQITATERAASMQRAIESLEEQVIALEAFFASSQDVTQDEFSSFARATLARHAEIQALCWAPLEEPAAPGQEPSVTIAFAQPWSGMDRLSGVDLARDPRLRQMLERAGRSGAPAAAPLAEPASDEPGGPETLLAMPHVREGRLKGYLVAIVHAGDLLARALGQGDPRLEVILLDDAPGRGRVLGFVGGGSAAMAGAGEVTALEAELEAAEDDGRVALRPLRCADSSWRLAVVASPEFVRGGHTWMPWLLLAAGLLVSSLVALALVLSARHSDLLAREASRDVLSRLLNRRGLEQALADFRDVAPLSALLVNFDDFAEINRAYGHGVGDVVLAELASRLDEAAGSDCTTGRIGGDEFLVLAPRTDAAAARELAERIRRRIAALPVLAMPRSVHVTASVGFARVADPAPSLVQIIAEARRGLSVSKAEGKNRASLAPEAGGERPVQARGEVERICREGALRVLWEPLVRLSDEQIIGYELLVRGPAGPFEKPAELFRAATEEGLLTLLDLRCLNACVDAARARDVAGDLHLNLLPSTLLDVPVSAILRALEAVRGEGRWRACLEVNEQQFVSHPAYLKEAVSALRAAGVRIAIDDVGSGRGTLDSVLVLEPDIVKIDVSLVRGASEDVARSVQLGRLVRLCQSLDIAMIAEGVETVADRDFVRALGIPVAQGYLWHDRAPGAPRPA